VRIWRRDYREYKRSNGQKGDPERMKRLESIGLVDDITTWDTKEVLKEIWYGMFNQLLEFKKNHGHVKVPQQYDENKKLGIWVMHRRRDYREYKRTNGQKGDPERMKHLESIGLVGDSKTGDANGRVNTSWNDMYNQLLEFKQKHGHVKVPQRDSENKKLAIWVRIWRSNYRKYKRTNGQTGDPERMKCLESIGLVDDITTGYEQRCTKTWNDMYNQLLEFKQKHGHVKVPRQYDENPKLGIWVMTNRNNYREYKRSKGQKGDPERMKHLESIGLVDDIRIPIHHEKMTNCANIKVPTPMIVSSMSPSSSSHTQTITKEIPLLAGIKVEEKSGDNSGGVNHTQVDLNFLGSELRGKGGFWV
jgi:glycerol-3-phosphate cytidylyltransferase-like family protein